MVRKFIRAGLFAALGALALTLSYGAVVAQDKKAADVSTIMQKSFGKGGYKTSIPAAVKDAKWDDAAKLAKEWAELGAGIGKNKAPKGEAKSWEEQCAKFVDATKAVVKAAEAKDDKAVGKAIGGFNCGGCHKAHKP